MKMRTLAVGLLTAMFGAVAAHAQLDSPPVAVTPNTSIERTPEMWNGFKADFDRRPNGQDFANNYPGEALRSDVSGTVTLCCTANSNRELACRAAAEWPEAKWRFGRASEAISRRFRMTEASYAEMQALGVEEIRVPIRWSLEPVTNLRLAAAMRSASVAMSETPYCKGEAERLAAKPN